MSSKLSGAAIVMAVLGIGANAGAADLYHLNPANSSFTATGQGTVTGKAGTYTCDVSLTGAIRKATGSITGVTLSGPAGCENVMPMNLPWTIRAISLRKMQITHFTLSYPGLGRCGPNQVNAVISAGNISIQDHVPSNEGVCDVNASLTSSPPLSITTN